MKRMMWRWIWIYSVGVDALGLAVSAQAARWHQCLTATSVVTSIDRTSLCSNRAGHKTFLARTVLRHSERRTHGAHYRPGTVILSCQEIDYHRQRIRLIDYVVRGSDGATLDTDTAVGTHWMRVCPGTLVVRSAAYVCGRR